jgi:hypothetical protein
VPDCVRRHGVGGHQPLDHRLSARDQDLNNPGASYFYEGCYFVPNDGNTANNIGNRICTMEWTGSVWDFDTPDQNNPLVEGPAIYRWGEMHTTVPVAAGDGHVILAVQTSDLGGGRTHYEYALFNFNSERRIGSFSIPVEGVQGIENIGFHDSDMDGANEWAVTLEGGVLTWKTDTYAEDPDANALIFGGMMNFRFDAASPPQEARAVLGIWKPSSPDTVGAETRGPTTVATGVAESGGAAAVRLHAARPNPLSDATTISFETARSAEARLDVYDLQGRRVRTLHSGTAAAGVHDVVWNGKDEAGRASGSGVYLIRLQASGTTLVRSVTLIR